MVRNLCVPKYMSHCSSALFALSLLSAFCASFGQAQSSCEQLTQVTLANAKVMVATMVPAQELVRGRGKLSGPIHVDAHCEIKGVATPTSDSEIHFLVWLPAASAWNGKYMQLGSGGWGGVIGTHGMITPLNRGYAVAATDDGHDGTKDGSGKFTVGHPEKLIDFGYRAIHQTSIQSRVILNAFYDKPQSHAYFVGCSDGGREALMQAQRFPEDFDGIVAGAPANHWTHQFTGFVWNERALFSTGTNVLPAEKLPLLEKAALKACDDLDGLHDGLITDPRACHFDPAVLQCKKTDQADCLTAEQVSAAKQIYSGPKDPVTGEQIYPGYAPGTEAEDSAWENWILGRRQADFGNSNFADATYENTDWDWRTSNLHDDLVLTDAKVAPVVNSYNPDLRSFRDHGGKLIQYHGWGDAAVAPEDSINYYTKVGKFLSDYPDPRERGQQPIESFYRLFMVPGMSHCWGGAGTGSFGNEVFPAEGVPQDADHDIVLALDRWVVDSIAPASIIATRTKDQPPSIATPGPMTRPLCPYPQTARYKGSGPANDAASFECRASSTGR
jgi:feruloyl esterase